MRSFSFTTSEEFRPLVVFDDFLKFETQSIVLEEVTSLTFVLEKMSPNYLDEPIFRRFMSVFPNVKRLDIRISISDQPVTNSNSEGSNSGSSISSWTRNPSASENNQDISLLVNASIYNCILQRSVNLESVRINLCFRTLSKIGVSFLKALSNLNQLCLDWPYPYDTNRILVDRLRAYLQPIPSLEIRNYGDSVLLLLRNLNVKHLTVRRNVDMMDLNAFREVLLSKVQSASLIFVDYRNSASNLPRLRVNTTLTVLNLRNYCTTYDKVALIVAFCGALIHLSIAWVSNEVLQSIFKNQKNLRSLCLYDCQKCNLDGFTGSKRGVHKLSIRELQNLEHLTIERIRVAVVKSRRLKEAFSFLRLKYLNLKGDIGNILVATALKSKPGKLPIKLFESMQNLVALRVMFLGEASFEELKTLCLRLKNLRYLCHDPYSIRKIGVTILDLSKSTFEDFRSKKYPCRYDEEMNKIVLTRTSLKNTLFSPKISSFVIHWIKF